MEIKEIHDSKEYMGFTITNTENGAFCRAWVYQNGETSFDFENDSLPLKLITKAVKALEMKGKKKWGTAWGS